MSTDVSVTLSVVEGSHVIFISALREMSRQARHDRYLKIRGNLSYLCHLCAIKHNAKLLFNFVHLLIHKESGAAITCRTAFSIQLFYNVHQFSTTPASLVGFCVNVELVG